MSKVVVISGEKLKRLLELKEHPIKVLFKGDERPRIKVDAWRVLRLLQTGSFVGLGSSQRVRQLREELTIVPALPWKDCWRTEEAGVLAFWADGIS